MNKPHKNNLKTLRPNSAGKPGDAKAELQLLRDRIVELAQKNPAKAATILHTWLNSQANAPRKKAG